MSGHTPGPFRQGSQKDSIVSDHPVQDGATGVEDVGYYGGYLVAETVAPRNIPLLAAAPEFFDHLTAFVTWWEQAGIVFYSDDEGLKGLVEDAIVLLAKADGAALARSTVTDPERLALDGIPDFEEPTT